MLAEYCYLFRKYLKSFIVKTVLGNLRAKEEVEERMLEGGMGRTIRTDIARSSPRRWSATLDPEYVAQSIYCRIVSTLTP